MIGAVAGMSTPAPVKVYTSTDGGHSPETWAELATDVIVKVADNATPEVQAQAHAFREQVQKVVLHYLREAVAADRRTVVVAIEKTGQRQLATFIKDL